MKFRNLDVQKPDRIDQNWKSFFKMGNGFGKLEKFASRKYNNGPGATCVGQHTTGIC